MYLHFLGSPVVRMLDCKIMHAFICYYCDLPHYLTIYIQLT